MMQFTRINPNPYRHVLVCDACGSSIRDGQGMYILRETYALPEEPAYHVHTDCTDRFEKQHTGRWDRFAARSREAFWFL